MNRKLLEIFPVLKEKKGDASDLISAALSLYLASLEDEDRKKITSGIELSLDQLDQILSEEDVIFINAIHPKKNYVIETGFENDHSVSEELVEKKVNEMRGLLPSVEEAAIMPEVGRNAQPYISEDVSMDDLGLSIEGEVFEDTGVPAIFEDTIQEESAPEQEMFNVFANDDDEIPEETVDGDGPELGNSDGFFIGDEDTEVPDTPDVHVNIRQEYPEQEDIEQEEGSDYPSHDMGMDIDYGGEFEEEEGSQGSAGSSDTSAVFDLDDESDLEEDEDAMSVVDKYIYIGENDEEED